MILKFFKVGGRFVFSGIWDFKLSLGFFFRVVILRFLERNFVYKIDKFIFSVGIFEVYFVILVYVEVICVYFIVDCFYFILGVLGIDKDKFV